MKKYTYQEALDNKKQFIKDVITVLEGTQYKTCNRSSIWCLCDAVYYLTGTNYTNVMKAIGLTYASVKSLTPHLANEGYDCKEPMFYFNDLYNYPPRVEYLEKFLLTL